MDIKLFDTHAHLDDERFENEYEGGSLGVIRDCFASNIEYLINIGTNLDNSRRSLELSDMFEGLYASVGIHPSETLLYDDIDYVIDKMRELLKRKKAVAIGEIGLDYHYDDVPRDIQMVYFKRQMELAAELSIPVIIHDREAHGDCLNVIKEFPSVKGVFHSFSGSAEMARELMSLGWYVSFSGTVTFKNAQKPKEACRFVDLDRLLIETDAPYLAPTPHRGELNRSTYVYFTAEEIARQRETTVSEIAKVTMENAKRLFNIK